MRVCRIVRFFRFFFTKRKFPSLSFVQFSCLVRDSWWRSTNLAGGGSHGNAILSRFDLTSFGCKVHSVVPLNWERVGTMLLQPRLGSRNFVWANVSLPDGTQLRVVSSHLENFCGIAARMEQFAEVLEHCCASEPTLPTIIGGMLVILESAPKKSAISV